MKSCEKTQDVDESQKNKKKKQRSSSTCVYFFLAELHDVLLELLQLCTRGHAACRNVVGCSTQSHTQLLILLRQITQLPQTLTLFLLQSFQATAQVLLQLQNRQVFFYLERFSTENSTTISTSL